MTKRQTAAALMLVLASSAPLAEERSAGEQGRGTVAPAACPAEDPGCAALEAARVACEVEHRKTVACGGFVRRLRDMMRRCDCSTPEARCEAPRLQSCPAAGKAFSTLVSLGSPSARDLLASPVLRRVAAGFEGGEDLVHRSREAETSLRTGRWARRPAPTATASSELRTPGVPHDADRVLDLSWQTAWCVLGTGVGEWIEVRPACDRGQGVRGVRVATGWSFADRPSAWTRWTGEASAARFALHGRAVRLRISSCEDAGVGRTIELRDAPGFEDFELPAQLPGPACVRLTILGSKPGRHDDTCISEVQAWCRTPGHDG